MSKLYHVSSSPHARSRLTTGKVMRQVICALLPAAGFGIYRYGESALLVLAVSLLVFVFGGKGFMDVGALQISPTLNINMNIIYSILPISGVLIALYSLINIAEIMENGLQKEHEEEKEGER